MKKRFFVVLCVVAVCTVAVFFSCAKKAPVLTIANDTGYDLYLVVIRPASSADWEDEAEGEIDVLDDFLENGDYVRVTLPSSGSWDLIAIDDGGDYYSKYNFKVGKDTGIVIDSDDLD